jgi:hypothetical protein
MFKKLFGLADGVASTAEATATPPFVSAAEVLALDQKVNALAAAMTPEKAVLWAGKSAEMVQQVTSPDDAKAAQSAIAFAKVPQLELKEQALDAANAVGKPGPGAMAAQAAGLAEGQPVDALVAGVVKLAAALNVAPAKVASAVPDLPPIDMNTADTPELPPVDPNTVMPAAQALQQLSGPDLAKTAQALQPFLELGEGIQSGIIT